MFEFERRVNYLKNIVADNKDKLQDDDFIDYTNEIFARWYNPISYNSKYKAFISNGIYKLVFVYRNSIKLSMFSAKFYEYLLINYPSYVIWFANHINHDTINTDDVNKYVDKYMYSSVAYKHDTSLLNPIVNNPLLAMSAINIVNASMNKYWYYGEGIDSYLRLILLYFLIVSRYGVNVFSKHVVNQFKNKTDLYYDVYAVYNFLCNKFHCNPNWNVKEYPNICVGIVNKHCRYKALLSTDMFIEDYNSVKEHLHDYVIKVLHYNPNISISASIDKFMKSKENYSKPIELKLHNELNSKRETDRQIIHDIHTISAYRDAYTKMMTIA